MSYNGDRDADRREAFGDDDPGPEPSPWEMLPDGSRIVGPFEAGSFTTAQFLLLSAACDNAEALGYRHEIVEHDHQLAVIIHSGTDAQG